MKKILLVCAGGFSTSMLARRMEEAARNRGVAVEIYAVGEDQAFDDIVGDPDVDILILGPQLGHKLNVFQEESPIPVMIVNSFDYGTMNGEKVFNEVLEKLGEK